MFQAKHKARNGERWKQVTEHKQRTDWYLPGDLVCTEEIHTLHL